MNFRNSKKPQFFACLLTSLFIAVASAQDSPQRSAEQAAAAASTAASHAQSAAKSAMVAASAASAVETHAWATPSAALRYGIPLFALFGSLIAVLSIKSALSKTPWSLADALSEETQLTMYKDVIEVKADGTKISYREVARDKQEQPVLINELRASTSRVIALMGMLAILFLFIGFGVFILYAFGSTGSLPADSIDRVVHFLLAGLTLFAPYLVNKFASIFQGLSGGK